VGAVEAQAADAAGGEAEASQAPHCVASKVELMAIGGEAFGNVTCSL
jgi:hypothetical protein